MFLSNGTKHSSVWTSPIYTSSKRLVYGFSPLINRYAMWYVFVWWKKYVCGVWHSTSASSCAVNSSFLLLTERVRRQDLCWILFNITSLINSGTKPGTNKQTSSILQTEESRCKPRNSISWLSPVLRWLTCWLIISFVILLSIFLIYKFSLVR